MKTAEKIQFLQELNVLTEEQIQELIAIDREEFIKLTQDECNKNHHIKKLALEQSKITLRIFTELKSIAIRFIEVRHKTDYHGQYIFLILVSLVLIAVLILALSGKIEQNTVGNIISSIVGFSIGKFTEKSGS